MRISSVVCVFGFLGVTWGAAASAAEPAGALASPDSLDGPPFVSCRAWAVADGETGKLLWGHDAATPLKAASTTKMMCAHVVLTLAQKDPAVLDEIVTFSAYADKTAGSTADVRTGETLPVRECLYGLLLPSGNDAGNALAEHFNARLAPPDDASEGDKATPRSNFIAEMNRTARSLGMADTVYRSPYGDGGTPQDTTTTARDLLKPAFAAMQEPLFRQYVSTVRHECDVTRPDGRPRRVVWQNTNELLKIKGYDGVKTGTTTLAGCCLVSSGRRGDDRLLVAVLGSTSSDGRYVDARNLYLWAWRQRGHGETK
jgi:D-alanyl-D-alanine carboxypeptidase (penicillin-binding protein 5/6)